MELFKVTYSSLEHLNVVVAGNVLIAAIAEALAVAHLTEDTAIGRSDTLDSKQGAVGVEGSVHGGVAVQVHILGGDLTVLGQFQSQLLACEEAAFAVGDGNIHHIAHIHHAQPGALIGCDPGTDDPALVAADGVEGQSGAGIIGVDDLAVGNQTQLDQCLEAVADTAHQAIPLLQQLGDSFLDGRVAEECGDELCGAIGLVAAGEAAGDEDHLAVCNALCHILDAFAELMQVILKKKTNNEKLNY